MDVRNRPKTKRNSWPRNLSPNMPPKIESMETPTTRAEFELRFHHLREALGNGRMSIPLNMGESLLKLRLLPNRRLDFLSVDEMARLQANMMLRMFQFDPMLQGGEDRDSEADEAAPDRD